MKWTVTAGCLLLKAEGQPARYGEPFAAPHGDPPIYAALVTEWQDVGRMVPGARDAQWTVLTSVGPATTGSYGYSAAQPRYGGWDGAVDLPPERRTDLIPVH
ncbi:hypothetical protein [Streptomyces sp. S.PNR 29]|uniref:hypothetical protein n=1 Tax=Streptomyces sp. S.PNR 29 TaxID=2973805 RepID=UPI0025B1D059|nr:hypothetical protein [Streptomyces sp. S.PNR 29]MDN0199794.1 hypothetical protein [Streptomyces sp. S.PNR 29]